jgi:ABC-type transporter Mla maintaining outer membrane lipid asymmetry ATPase subunit MlaF
VDAERSFDPEATRDDWVRRTPRQHRRVACHRAHVCNPRHAPLVLFGLVIACAGVLAEIAFKAGPTPSSTPLQVKPAAITIVVGPNNSGKSVALREIESLLTDRSGAPRFLIKDARLEDPGVDALDAFRPFAVGEEAGSLVCLTPFSANGVRHYPMGNFPHMRKKDFSSWSYLLGQVCVTRLDGPSRLSLVNPQDIRDSVAPPPNHLVRLFQDDQARADLRKLVHEAFERHLVVDPTHIGQLRVRLSDRAPTDSSEEQGLTQRARDFHAKATPIEDFSEGVRAYTGLLAALLSLSTKVLLIDEPDAFLHPPLARRLGHHIAALAKKRGAQVVAATHSSEFLMGCIESGADVEIVRLTYTGGVATARHLPQDQVKALAREPLMRSANVLAALFHDGAIVTESDNDRAFYHEINYRLTAVDEGARGSLFLNAQNKQTVGRIIQPLRALGVPAATIVDIDILNKGGTEWSRFLDAGNVPPAARKSFEGARAALAANRTSDWWSALKKNGTASLGAAERLACEDLLKQLAVYGLFVVPVGEVEGWLSGFGVTGAKHAWAVAMLDRLGADPSVADYIAPTPGDVWDFLRGLARWLGNPLRKGLPL